ncbi:MalY/PatB family protein [Methyloterricola oryzae]|uniref:MalY/PatB family protein n=1 Tax=Methyloterricola oryzae TaxID=1495050 RepID=UPI0005EBD92C|nr:PatB family C-S lyase [Methyloterricola oryzae]
MTEFDRIIPREETASVKYDGRTGYFGKADVIPLWVADMDFAVPEAVSTALARRAAHPVFGYTLATDGVLQSLIDWQEHRHGWRIEREWIILCPGVVPALHAAVLALSEPGAGVLVQPPVYFPFFSAVTTCGRRLLENQLLLDDGRYAMDYADLEQHAQAGASLLILCSPHNPVGRVWDADELARVLEIADRYGMTVLSDEIHADLVYPGYRNRSLGHLAGNADNIVTAVAPSKTFNIPGLGLSALVVPCPQRRQKLREAFGQLHMTASNPFSLVAFEAAYREGGPWLDRLLAYLAQTRDFVRDFLRTRLPAIHLIEPEGTYLLWMDCRKLGLTDAELQHFFVHEAGVGMNPGTVFGRGGSGFMRMNIGAPRSLIAKALEQIDSAARRRGLSTQEGAY